MSKVTQSRMVVWIAFALVWWIAACADVDDGGNAVGGSEQALTTPIDIDFSSYPLGPLGSPWTVTNSGSGTSTIVDTTDHGHALRIAHGAVARDFSSAQLTLSNTTDTLEFDFQVKPKSSASTFTITVQGTKSGYGTGRFALSLVPGSNVLTVSSIGANGGCGSLAYGKWSSVQWKLRPDSPGSTRRVIDVRVNGVLATTCTAVSTSLRVANSLIIMDNTQPSANTESLFDDFFAQSGS